MALSLQGMDPVFILDYKNEFRESVRLVTDLNIVFSGQDVMLNLENLGLFSRMM
jgi:hypothetical protein